MADVSNSKLLENNKDIRDLQDVLVILVKTEWNDRVVDELEAGAVRVLHQNKIRTKTIVVPGCIEIPFAVQQSCSQSNTASAFIALGCVIRGGTPHFEYVCQSVTQGITQLNLTLPVPVIFGVLTTDTVDQAMNRSKEIGGNKGKDAAMAAIEMVNLLLRIK